jgi:hypothetical protein
MPGLRTLGTGWESPEPPFAWEGGQRPANNFHQCPQCQLQAAGLHRFSRPLFAVPFHVSNIMGFVSGLPHSYCGGFIQLQLGSIIRHLAAPCCVSLFRWLISSRPHAIPLSSPHSPPVALCTLNHPRTEPIAF